MWFKIIKCNKVSVPNGYAFGQTRWRIVSSGDDKTCNSHQHPVVPDDPCMKYPSLRPGREKHDRRRILQRGFVTRM